MHRYRSALDDIRNVLLQNPNVAAANNAQVLALCPALILL